MTETVLVIGGTGQLGAPVARQLRRDGYRVRLLARTLPAAPDRDAHLEYVQGDLDDTKSLRSALAGCAAVHVSVRGGPATESYDRVEHRGPAQIAELATLAGVGRLTYVSHMLATPDAAAAPTLRAKFHAEQAIAASAVPSTILRPTYFMETLPRQVRGTQAVVLGRQPHPFHMIAAADFARMVSRALATPGSAGTRLDIHGPEAITIADALRIYCERLAPGTRVVTRPLWFMTVLDRTVLGGQLRGTLELMRVLQQAGERGDPSQANQLLGHRRPPCSSGASSGARQLPELKCGNGSAAAGRSSGMRGMRPARRAGPIVPMISAHRRVLNQPDRLRRSKGWRPPMGLFMIQGVVGA